MRNNNNGVDFDIPQTRRSIAGAIRNALLDDGLLDSLREGGRDADLLPLRGWRRGGLRHPGVPAHPRGARWGGRASERLRWICPRWR